MTIEHKTDHVEDGLRLPLAQFRDKPIFAALLASWLTQVQEAEDAIYSLLLAWLPNAVGVQLDRLGKIVGQPREGRADDRYRIWIAARVLVNRSSGLTEQVLAIVEKLVDGKQIRLREEPPAAFTIEVLEQIPQADGIEIAKILQKAKAAGGRALLEWFSVPTANVFRFSDDGTEQSGNELAGLSYGKFGSVSDGRSYGVSA